MTILMALELGNGILFGSDSAMTHVDDKGVAMAQQTLTKIWEHPSNPDLVWGFTGDGAVGSQFGDWVRSQLPESWEPFLWEAGKLLAKLNGEGKRSARQAGAPKEFEAATVIMGGYLGPKRDSKLVDISSAGGAYPYPPGKVVVSSSATAKASAFSAWEAVVKIAPDADMGAAFLAVMEATIAANPPLKGPVQRKFAFRTRDPAPTAEAE